MQYSFKKSGVCGTCNTLFSKQEKKNLFYQPTHETPQLKTTHSVPSLVSGGSQKHFGKCRKWLPEVEVDMQVEVKTDSSFKSELLHSIIHPGTLWTSAIIQLQHFLKMSLCWWVITAGSWLSYWICRYNDHWDSNVLATELVSFYRP